MDARLALGMYLGAANGGQGWAAALPSIPLSSDSIWNVAIPDTPTVKSNSAAIVTKLASWNSGQPMPFAAGVDGTADDFNIPVYFAVASDPLYTLSLGTIDARELQISGTQIRMPAAAVATVGSDHHLVVVDENRQWVYEFWNVSSLASNTITAAAGGRFRYSGDGFDNANAVAAKTAALAGRITTDEWIAAAAGRIHDFGHAIAITVKSTDGTTVWPSYGIAGVGDTVDAPPDGTWLQYNDTVENINAMSLTNVGKAILRTALKYGMIVMDTNGNTGSWNLRSLGNDAADFAILGTQPMKAHAIAQGPDGGWNLFNTFWYFGGVQSGIDWAGKLRVLDPAYMKSVYDVRIAYKKLDPIATIQDTGPWTKTGGATIHACLSEAVYAPFDADASIRIGTNTVGRIAEFRVATLTVPVGKTLKALTLWFYGNAAAASSYTARIKSGATVKASYALPTTPATYGWRAVTMEDVSGVDLADIRGEFEYTAGTGFSNIYAAHVMAEFAAA